jgi:hypothetical protein
MKPECAGIDMTQLRKRFARAQLINQFCASLRGAASRRRFHSNESAYCLSFGLNREERQAVRDRDFLTLIDMGAHLSQVDMLAVVSGRSMLETYRLRQESRILE